MSVPIVFNTAATFMVTPGRTLQRIIAVIPAGSTLSISHDFDRAPTAASPSLVNITGNTTQDVVVSLELGMKLPAGTTLQQQGAPLSAMLVFD